MKPSVGRIVHYVSPLHECTAAIVTKVHGVDSAYQHRVGLAVFFPNGGLFPEDIGYWEADDHKVGTWHWPEREEAE